MGVWERVTNWWESNRVDVAARSAAPFSVSYEYPDLPTQSHNAVWWRGSPYRLPSIADALAVPSILRAVTLIANSAGQLSVQGWRDGSPMPNSPRLVTRPDPDRTPREFYGPSAWNMATRGEVVWCIMARDTDGLATSLVVVPLAELNVEPNPNDRRRPRYSWGHGRDRIVSTRWTPSTPDGRFVHVFLTPEAGELRGKGPLQYAGAAVSVSVEAQDWAANFYRRGGYPSVNLHSDTELEDTEATDLRNQWTATPPNTPLVTSGDMHVNEIGVNPQGAQMLDARSHQDGEAARMYGIPGALLEFNAPGSSLTYQNIAEVFTLFVKTCLAPNYLEPMEQALSDLLPRSTVGRFNVEGFYRADAKTRWEVYEIATRVIGVDDAAALAREREGLAPGDIEFKPVPFAPPAAVPTAVPLARTAAPVAVELRCDGMMQKRRSGVTAVARCGKLLSTSGVFVGRCPRCKKEYPTVAA